VSGVVRAECDVAIDQCSFNWRKLTSAEILLAQQAVDRACPHSTEEHPFGVHPTTFHFRGAGADKNRTRRAQRYQLVGINGQIVGRQRASVPQKIARHPVVLARGGDILDLLAERPAQNLGAAFTRRSDETDGKARIVS